MLPAPAFPILNAMTRPPDDPYAFLRGHVPFDRMAEEAVRGIVPRLRLARFAKDATILSAQAAR